VQLACLLLPAVVAGLQRVCNPASCNETESGWFAYRRQAVASVVPGNHDGLHAAHSASACWAAGGLTDKKGTDT